jgi:hypothetical protein
LSPDDNSVGERVPVLLSYVTEIANMVGIIKEGHRPGGHKGGRTQVFLNPFAP